MHKAFTAATALGLALGFSVTAAQAKSTPEEKCQGSKNLAVGKYAMCRQKAEKRLVLTGDTEKYGTAVALCETLFGNGWQAAEAKAAKSGATCPDAPLSVEQFEAVVDQLSGNVATALGGGALLSCAVGSQRLKTGQTQCDQGSGALPPGVCPGSPLGQDGELQHGLARSYTDNGDGTITDNQTGLMWEKQSGDGSIHDAANVYTWYTAFTTKIATLNSESFAGHSDWRLPNVNELHSLLDYSRGQPAADPAFAEVCVPGCTVLTCNCSSLATWSSTSQVSDPDDAWYVSFLDGIVVDTVKSLEIGARAVRGGSGPAQPLKTGQAQCDQGAGTLGACPGSPAGQDAALAQGAARSYTDNGDGTITDNNTGLMWESLSNDGSIHDYTDTYTWYEAFTKISALNSASFAGHSDWRLPNVNELQSLASYRRPNLAIDPVFDWDCTVGCTTATCSCVQSGPAYWSSTTYEALNTATGEAWLVYPSTGLVYPGSKALLAYYVRAVRTGP